MGVWQGETLFPLLNSLYINDLEPYLINKGNNYVTVTNVGTLENSLKILVLMHADDTVIFSESADVCKRI